MKRLVLPAVMVSVAGGLAGCGGGILPQQQPAEVVEANPVHPLSWVENAVVNVDIENALAHKDYRLLAFEGRRITVPGVDSGEVESAQTLCGVELLSGPDGDKGGDRNQALINKAFDYAYQYNREMLELCKLAHNI